MVGHCHDYLQLPQSLRCSTSEHDQLGARPPCEVIYVQASDHPAAVAPHGGCDGMPVSITVRTDQIRCLLDQRPVCS